MSKIVELNLAKTKAIVGGVALQRECGRRKNPHRLDERPAGHQPADGPERSPAAPKRF